jgi:RNA polymerase sigma-70 factor (ECF subfamily)
MGRGEVVERGVFSAVLDRPPAAARGAGAQALGDLFQSFRPYLLSVARRGLPGGLRARYDPADLVQETLLDAHRCLAGFHGPDPDALRGWLCGILRHNLMDLNRRYRGAAKRSIDRERSLAAGPGSDAPGDGEIDPHPDPCTQSIAREDAEALRDALARLPAHERSAIALRFFEVLSFPVVGQRLGCSPEAARKICTRAMTRLQRMLKVARGPGASINGRARAEDRL